MLKLVEEAFTPISIAAKKSNEDLRLGPVCHRTDVGPDASACHRLAQCIAVISSVREQDLLGLQAIEQHKRTPSVMRLSQGELDRDRQAVGVNQGHKAWSSALANAPCTRLEPGSEPRMSRRRPTFLSLAPC
jgi:hypothetical protein